MPETFRLTFYGTRGTRTTPGPQCSEFGGHTTCVHLKIGERDIIIDAGSGIVGLGNQLIGRHCAQSGDGPLVSHLFLTHCHYDHICGFPYYSPLYHPNSTTYIRGPVLPQRTAQGQTMTIEDALGLYVHPPFHPVPLHEMQGHKVWGQMHEPETIFFLKDQEAPVAVNTRHATLRQQAPPSDRVEAVVRCLRGYNHPKSGVMIYRVEHAGRAVVIATDTEGYVGGDQRLIDFARGAQVLVHDAMYTQQTYTGARPTQGWGHSTVDCATSVARQAGVDSVYLIHHSPAHDDGTLRAMESEAQTLFSTARAARDGLTIDLLADFPG